jgi:CTP:molybdopterin cytidylyltransferase MocA
MPDVTSAILDQLIAAFNCAPDRAAVAPVYEGRRGNPVLLGRRLFPRLAVDEKSVLADIDTREDLERALGGRL